MTRKELKRERKDLFRLNPKAAIGKTYNVIEFVWYPCIFTIFFGPPVATDRHKKSGRYIFENDQGEVFIVHDWKQTTLYLGRGKDIPTPKQFWYRLNPSKFIISGRRESDAERFRDWLMKKCRKFESAIEKLLDLKEEIEKSRGLNSEA